MTGQPLQPRRFQPNWVSIIFFGVTHFIGIFAWPLYLILGGNVRWPELVIFAVMFALGVIGINVGYHRALSHLSFKMSSLLKFFALVGGASVAEGSALCWCADHRRHHKYQDTDKDPYNIHEGLWWAHMGWLFGSPTTKDFSNVPDLQRDPLIQNQHRYFVIWLVVFCFGLPLALGFLFGRPLQALLLAGFTRLFLFNHATFVINSFAHYFGKRPYSLEVTARDSFIWAVIANGEGWHNYHHKFPFDFRCGPRFYQYDPAKWFIFLGQFFGIAKDLKKTPPQEIYRARIQTERTKLKTEPEHLRPITEALDKALARWTALGLEWERFKKDMGKRRTAQMRALSDQIASARQDFKSKYDLWLQQVASQTHPG